MAATDITGQLVSAPGTRIGIVVGRFNEVVTDRLLAGCLDMLARHGVAADQCVIVRVPGAFEVPLVARRLADSGTVHGIVCLGAVIRGETPHFDYVAGQAASGIASVMLEHQIPVVFGVLTVDTTEQALDRAGLKSGNKGADAALAVLEMIDCLRQIDKLSIDS